jgi:hypothetical protein
MVPTGSAEETFGTGDAGAGSRDCQQLASASSLDPKCLYNAIDFRADRVIKIFAFKAIRMLAIITFASSALYAVLSAASYLSPDATGGPPQSSGADGKTGQ